MEMIRVRDAAQRWNLTERSVTNFCKAGKISGARKQGRSWLIPAACGETGRQPDKVRGVPEEYAPGAAATSCGDF